MDSHGTPAWKLLEALHEPFTNEERLTLIHQFSDKVREEAYARGLEDGRRAAQERAPSPFAELVEKWRTEPIGITIQTINVTEGL